MDSPRNILVELAGGDRAVHLLLVEGEVRLPVTGPEEQVREDIRLRATKVSRVLEEILHEPHGELHWGLNE